MEFSRQDWAANKAEIAKRLSDGECKGSYAEAVIILSAVISAIAAEIWPGKGIDRKRFVEVMKEYGDTNLNTIRVSIPLLIKYLSNDGRKAEGNALHKEFVRVGIAQVLVGDEVDQFEQDIISFCPSLSITQIRKFSYPNVLYGEVRSCYVHEYRIGKSAGSFPMTSRKEANASYINRFNPESNITNRLIHFHVDWLIDVVKSISTKADSECDKYPLDNPPRWWIDGIGEDF